MIVQTCFKWLFLLLIVGVLSACGGGSDGSPSTLFGGSTGDGDTGGGSTPTTPTAPSNISILLSGPDIVPLGRDRAEFTLTTFEEITNAESVLTPTVAGVPMNVTVTGSAYFAQNGLKSIDVTSDGSGEAFFTLINPVNEQVLLTVRATGNYTGGATFPLYFGTTSNVVINGTSLPADGSSSATLVATVVDFFGSPVPDIRVSISTPNSFATVTQATGITNSEGKFTTSITNTVAEIVQVRTAIDTQRFLDVVTFVGTGVDGDGGTIDLSRIDVLVRSNNVRPNGQDQASVVVVARNSAGVPVRNLAVGVSSNSGTATMSIPGGASQRQFFIEGNTGSAGSFIVNLTNTREETVTLTASFGQGDPEDGGILVESQPVGIVFQTPATVDGITISDISLDAPIENPSPARANGRDTVTLSGTVLRSDGSPASGISVSLITSGGSASFPANVSTNAAGLFFADFTDTVAETFSVRAVVGSISSTPTSLTFTAIPDDPDQPATIIPNSLTLLASPQQQEVGNAINLTVIARNANQSPLAGVEINVSALGNTSASAIFDFTETLVTQANGTVSFSVRNNVAGTFTVSAVARAGGPTASTDVMFIPSTSPEEEVVVPASLTLLADTLQQEINAPIRLTVVALDNNQTPLANVRLRTSVSGATGNSAIFDFSNSNDLVTGSNGTVEFAVTNSVAGQFTVSVVATTGGPTASLSLNFNTPTVPGVQAIDRLDVSTRNNNQPADGQSPIMVEVVALAGGLPVPDARITLISDSGNDGAVRIQNAVGTTDINGFYSAEVTSSQAGTVNLTISAEGLDPNLSRRVALNFTASSSINPDSIELSAEPLSQIANGNDGIVLVAIPRDSRGVPIPNLEVELLVTSNNFSGLTIESPLGTTNAIGEYRTIAKSSQPGTYTIKPVVAGTTLPAGQSEAIEIVFTAVEGRELDQLILNVVDNNQNAGVENFTRLLTLARATDGSPLGGVPVILRISPAPDVPDVSGSVIFDAQTGFLGETNENTGLFETRVSTPQPGTFQAQAFQDLGGGQTGLASNVVTVTFNTPQGGVPEVESLSLLTSRTQINSADGADTGAVITALVRDAENNPVPDATVSFSSDSGEIQAIAVEGSERLPGLTDTTGRAQARLTSTTNKNNRTITVTARVSKPDGSVLEATIPVDVVGTTLNIVGNSSVTTNDRPTFTAILRDSANAGISNQTLEITVTRNDGSQPSFVGAPGSNSQSSTATVTTNTLGQADVVIFTSTAGTDIITVRKPDAPAVLAASAEMTVSGDQLIVTPEGGSGRCGSIGTNTETGSPLCQIPLDTDQRFTIVWNSGDQLVTGANGEVIELSATRGVLSTNTGSPNKIEPPFVLPGQDSPGFNIRSTNIGTSKIVVRGNRTQGIDPTFEFSVEFVAVNANFINVQANPAVIGTNQVGETGQQSEIIAVVRDANNNLVKGRIVNFNLEDITGGRLTRSTVETNNFGEASTIYIAGSTSSAADGVKITASVVEASPGDTAELSGEVTLTVAQRSIFISVGSGNVMQKSENNTRYLLPHTVLVTDSNGTPVNNADVILSMYPKTYLRQNLAATGLNDSFLICQNEDINRNGILDPDEDRNNNGKLDPGNVITVDNLQVTTDETGFKDFNVVYAIQYANWVTEVELTARTTVAGTESRTFTPVFATCSQPDVANNICPVSNPFAPMTEDEAGSLCRKSVSCVADEENPSLITCF